jgi:hypothetical protein
MQDQEKIHDRFLRIASSLWRKDSKHAKGKRHPRNYRLRLKRARKRERKARQYARACAAGRKHRFRK